MRKLSLGAALAVAGAVVAAGEEPHLTYRTPQGVDFGTFPENDRYASHAPKDASYRARDLLEAAGRPSHRTRFGRPRRGAQLRRS